MTDKQIIYKLKNDIACKENIIKHLAEYNIKLEGELKRKEQECERLRQTLADIKEVAEKQCVCGVDCVDIKQILQLVSEVDDDRQD